MDGSVCPELKKKVSYKLGTVHPCCVITVDRLRNSDSSDAKVVVVESEKTAEVVQKGKRIVTFSEENAIEALLSFNPREYKLFLFISHGFRFKGVRTRGVKTLYREARENDDFLLLAVQGERTDLTLWALPEYRPFKFFGLGRELECAGDKVCPVVGVAIGEHGTVTVQSGYADVSGSYPAFAGLRFLRDDAVFEFVEDVRRLLKNPDRRIVLVVSKEYFFPVLPPKVARLTRTSAPIAAGPAVKLMGCEIEYGEAGAETEHALAEGLPVVVSANTLVLSIRRSWAEDATKSWLRILEEGEWQYDLTRLGSDEVACQFSSLE